MPGYLFLITMLLGSLDGIAQQAGRIKELAFLAGNWNIEVEARVSMQGEWERSNASSIIKFTLDSALIEEDFAGSRQGKPFLAKTLFAVNNMSNQFQRMFIDAPHGVLVDFEGGLSGDSLIFDKTWQYSNGARVKLRVVYKIQSPDEFSVVSMRMPQGAVVWDVNGKMRYRRKK